MRDLRKFARQTTGRLVIGAILPLIVVGLGLVALFYGPTAALAGLLCVLGGLVPILLVVLSLGLIEWIVKRANRD
jgi:hypothetical protein